MPSVSLSLSLSVSGSKLSATDLSSGSEGILESTLVSSLNCERPCSTPPSPAASEIGKPPPIVSPPFDIQTGAAPALCNLAFCLSGFLTLELCNHHLAPRTHSVVQAVVEHARAIILHPTGPHGVQTPDSRGGGVILGHSWMEAGSLTWSSAMFGRLTSTLSLSVSPGRGHHPI